MPVILANDLGGSSTGFVQLAPGNRLGDFDIGRQYGLEIVSPLDAEGRFNSQAGSFSGLNLADGERAILDSMSSRGSLAATTEAEEECPHCWRCNSPLIVRATEQWFVKLDHREQPDGLTLRERALLWVQLVNWMPGGSQERIRSMLAARPDWCISRQRFWGVPIPSVICRGCGKAILAPEVIKKVRDLVGVEGSAAWFERGVEELIPSGFTCPSCDGCEFEKDSHILEIGRAHV